MLYIGTWLALESIVDIVTRYFIDCELSMLLLLLGLVSLVTGLYLFFKYKYYLMISGCFLILVSGCLITHTVYIYINSEREASAESILKFIAMYKHLREADKHLVDEMVLNNYLADDFLSKGDIDELLGKVSKMKVCEKSLVDVSSASPSYL